MDKLSIHYFTFIILCHCLIYRREKTSSSLLYGGGALAGAAIGGGTGYYFDNQEAKFRKELESSGVGIKRNEEGIKLIMPGNITFKSGNSDINSFFYTVLGSVRKVFKKYKKTNGEKNPIASNRYTSGRERNRRVEMEILPKK